MFKLKKSILAYFSASLFCTGAFADVTDGVISTCQYASDRYSKFSYYWDQQLLNTIIKFPAGSKERLEGSQKIINEANEMLEHEEDTHFKANQTLLKSSSESDAKTKLLLIDQLIRLTILNSFNFVAENAKNNNLGKSESYYQRKLFQDCMK
jgi:hypothetical protein